MLFEWSNASTWPNFLGKEPIHDRPASEDIVDQFKDAYSRVRTFHSCRTENPDAYYGQGILVSSYSDLEWKLIDLAKSELGLEIPQDALRKISDKLGNYHESSCFVVLDKDRLLHTAAHYAIYGSERILAIVNHLEADGILINKELLTRRGRPTVLALDLELGDISGSDLHSLVREINNYTYYQDISGSLDFTFQLKNSIPGNRIVGHEHPSVLKDPMENFVARAFRS